MFSECKSGVQSNNRSFNLQSSAGQKGSSTRALVFYICRDMIDCTCVHIQLVLEMCRGEHPADMQAIQPHLDRIKAPVSTAKDHHVSNLVSVFLSGGKVCYFI